MRPKKKSYTLAALSAAGFCANVTGAIQTTPWTTIAGEPADNAAHLLSLVSTANLSTVAITVTGTDAENRIQTEAITGPNNETVYSTKYFKTVTIVTSSGTLGANTMNIGWTDACVTPAYLLDNYSLAQASLNVVAGGTIDYNIETSITNVAEMASTDWFNAAAPDITGSIMTLLVANATAIRVKVNSHTSGTLAMSISQAGYGS